MGSFSGEERPINEESSGRIKRGAIFLASVAFHVVLFYFIYHARWSYKIYNLKETRRDIVLLQPPRIRFAPAAPAGVPGEKPGTLSGQPGGRAGIPRRKRPPARPGEKEEGEGGDVGGAGEPGGVPGTGGGIGGGTASPYSRGFTLVFPADAMINLAKYAETPEDALLRPYRPAKSDVNFSKYVYPQTGGRGSVSGPGGPGGKFEPVRPGGSTGVMVSVPENVRTYDLSKWADAALGGIQRHWLLDRNDKAERVGQVGIQVHLMKSGEVTTVEVTSSSKIDTLDDTARRAVERAAPFPPLPEDFPFSSLEIYLVFRYGR